MRARHGTLGVPAHPSSGCGAARTVPSADAWGGRVESPEGLGGFVGALPTPCVGGTRGRETLVISPRRSRYGGAGLGGGGSSGGVTLGASPPPGQWVV